MASQASAFLTRLFSTKQEDDYLYLWELPTKKSYWYRSIPQAAIQAAVLKSTHDVYVGVGLSAQAMGGMFRCPADMVVGIPGLWADIDIQDPVHKKAKLPPTLEAAQALVDAMPKPPSLVIHSGHGLQAWWLFDTVWNLRPKGEREHAQELSQRWSDRLHDLAAESGYEVDSVYDLARVFRVPGTLNHKAEPVEVTILLDDASRRYEPYAIGSELPASPKRSQVARTATPQSIQAFGNLVLDPEAQIDQELFDLLCEIEPRFKASWKREDREDLKKNSASEHDLSMATFAAMAGWSDQTIVNLLIAVRRENGEDINKALRRDYTIDRTLRLAKEGAHNFHGIDLKAEIDGTSNTNNTINIQGPAYRNGHGTAVQSDSPGDSARGRGSADLREAVNGVEAKPKRSRSSDTNHVGRTQTVTLDRASGEDSTEPGAGEDAGPDAGASAEDQAQAVLDEVDKREKKRNNVLATVSGLLGTTVHQVTKFNGENPSYMIKLTRGDVTIASADMMMNQHSFHAKVASRIDVVLPKHKDDKWRNIVNMLMAVAEVTDIGDESTLHGMMRSWIFAYLSAHTVQDEFDKDKDSPFRENHSIVVYSDHFRKWLRTSWGENVKAQEIGMYFRMLSCVPSTVDIQLANGRWTQRNTWKIPEIEHSKAKAQADTEQGTQNESREDSENEA